MGSFSVRSRRAGQRWLISVAALASSPLAHANDSTFGGAGADLVPLDEPPVRMLSEDIALTAQEKSDEWVVQARYVLRNQGAVDVTVPVAFPELRCENGGSGDCANVAFRDLSTRVDGAVVQHRQGQLDERQGGAAFLGLTWRFNVRFPVGRDIRIEHRYRLASSGDLGGNRYVSYLTASHGWSGSIGRATFTVALPPYTRAVNDVQVPGLTTSPPRLVSPDGVPRVELRLEGSEWKPEGSIFFGYNASSMMTLQPIDVTQPRSAGAGSELFPWDHCAPNDPAADAQGCLNEVYASRGYPFRNPAIARRYYSGDPAFRLLRNTPGEVGLWVRDASALPGFSESWFDATDQARIGIWTERLLRERSGLVATAPRAGGGGAGSGSGAGAGSSSGSGSGGTNSGDPANVAEARSGSEAAPSVVVQGLRGQEAAAGTNARSEGRGFGGCGMGGNGAPGPWAALAPWLAMVGYAVVRRCQRPSRQSHRTHLP